MPGNDRDVTQGEPDPIGPPGHAGGTYAERDESAAAQRSSYRTDQATDAGFQQSEVIPAEPDPEDAARRPEANTDTTVEDA